MLRRKKSILPAAGSFATRVEIGIETKAVVTAAGFSLDEIRTLLPPDLDRWDHGSLVEALRRKVADIEALKMRRAQSRAQLFALLEDIEAKPGDMDCAANARRVLSRMLGKDVEGPTLGADDTKLLGKAGRRRSANAG